MNKLAVIALLIVACFSSPIAPSASAAPSVSAFPPLDPIDKPTLTITCPADAKVICGTPTDPAAAGFPIVTGGCDTNPTVTHSDVVITPAGCPAERFMQSILRTWTASDSCGASVSCTQTINVLKNLVSFDVIPSTCPNIFDRNGGGLVTMSVLGSSLFDVHTILTSTIELYVVHCAAGPALPIAGQFTYADVGRPFQGAAGCGCTAGAPDGFVDLVMQFDAVALQNALNLAGYPAGTDVRLTIVGTSTDDCRFIGLDCIRVSDCITCLTGPGGNTLTVLVNQNVNVDFNTNPPTYSGDPDLFPYFSYDNSGATADLWKAIFDVGGRQLVVASGATITVGDVPATSNNRRSPGIVIRSSCGVQVDAGGAVLVDSLNQPAGPILIEAGGDVRIDGTVCDVVEGTNGTPGKITISSCCGDITTGTASLICTTGQDWGGSDINILTCCPERAGDIVIRGLVDASYKALSAPAINIASIGGRVTIDGTTFLGFEPGTGRYVMSGVTMRSRRDPLAGTIRIQGKKDVTVIGNATLTTLSTRINYGAVAVKTASNSSVGGTIDVRSIAGRIVAIDRAIDDANRYNQNAVINLFAQGDIGLSVSASVNAGASNNTKAVVNNSGGTFGTTIGGTTRLRSHAGGISIGLGAQLLATGNTTHGINALTTCTGITNLGLVNPEDTDAADDFGACSPSAPAALFESCAGFGTSCSGCP